MLLDWPRDALLSTRPYPNSRIAIFNKDGDNICNPRLENPYQGNVYDSDELLQDFDYEIRGKLLEIFDWKDVGSIKMLGEPRYGHFTMAKDLHNGSQILITNLYEEAFRQIPIIWLIMGLFALFGLAAMFFISRRIITGYRAVASALPAFRRARWEEIFIASIWRGTHFASYLAMSPGKVFLQRS